MRRNVNFGADCRALEIRIAAFGEGDSKTSFADVMSGSDQAVSNCIRDEILNCTFVFQVHFSNEAVYGFDEHDRIACIPKESPRDKREVLDQSDHAQNGRRINVSAECLIVKAHVAAGDWCAEKAAGFG